MGAFEYRQAQEIRDCFQRHGIRYLFLGKSGAILLGFPDTTQDADIFAEKTPENCAALVVALRELGFGLNDTEAGEVARGKDLKSKLVEIFTASFDYLEKNRELMRIAFATAFAAPGEMPDGLESCTGQDPRFTCRLVGRKTDPPRQRQELEGTRGGFDCSDD